MLTLSQKQYLRSVPRMAIFKELVKLGVIDNLVPRDVFDEFIIGMYIYNIHWLSENAIYITDESLVIKKKCRFNYLKLEDIALVTSPSVINFEDTLASVTDFNKIKYTIDIPGGEKETKTRDVFPFCAFLGAIANRNAESRQV